MRLAQWEENLAGVVVAALERRFKWGAHDCASFAFACVLSITGIDLYRAYFGRYSTRESADKILGDVGGFAGFASMHFEAIGVASVLVGDLGLAKSGTLCVCAAPGRWVAPGPRGLAVTQSSDILRAWRVG